MLTNRLPLIVAVLAIAVLALFTVSMIASPRPSASPSLADDSNYAIELQRAQNYAGNAERSYDEIELQRAQRYAPSVDHSDDQSELQRAQNYAAAAARQAYQQYRQGEWTGK